MSRLIVVDDNEQNRYMLESLLRGHGYETITAADGTEALNEARQYPPDLIITDILMPGMDGYTLCREWRKDESLREIPLVFYTATYTDLKDEEFSLSLGAARFIIKPQEPDALLLMIEEVLAERKEGGGAEVPALDVAEMVYLKKYNEALIRKLEDKLVQLESANESLTREVRERRNAEEALRQSERELRIRTRIADVFLTVPDERIFTAVLDILLEVMESESGFFGFINADGALVVSSAEGSFRILRQGDGGTGVFRCDTWGDLIWARSMRETRTLFSNSPSQDGLDGNVPVERCLCTPLMDRKEVIGLFYVADKASDYTEQDVRLLETLGRAVAPILSARLSRDREQEERERLESQLRQALKMEAIGRLAGGVAHDFNNILQAMMISSSMLIKNAPENDEMQEYAEDILNCVERAAALTGHLLAFSRSQTLQMADLNLNEVIRGVMKMIRRIIGEDVEVRLIEGPNLDAIHADRGQMEQILLNFCVNSRDAMPEGGTLIIETETLTIGREFCNTHAWASQGRYVVLRVTDDGCGMDSQTLARIFEPFFTTKEVGSGTGLGLATVYGIVRQHQGMVNVYSEVGKGTTFSVYIPSVKAPAALVEMEAAPKVEGGSETILVAEDDDVLRRLATHILEGAGYTVLQASNGTEAIEQFEKQSEQIDLILLDMIMPKLSGKAVYDVLHGRYPDLPFLFSSGYTSSSVNYDFVREKRIEMIQKPYTPNALLRKIRSVLFESAVSGPSGDLPVKA